MPRLLHNSAPKSSFSVSLTCDCRRSPLCTYASSLSALLIEDATSGFIVLSLFLFPGFTETGAGQGKTLEKVTGLALPT